MDGFVLVEINALSLMMAAAMAVHRTNAPLLDTDDDRKYHKALWEAIELGQHALGSPVFTWDAMAEINTIAKGMPVNSETLREIPEDVLQSLRYAPQIDESIPRGMVRQDGKDVPVDEFVRMNRQARRAQERENAKAAKKRNRS